MCPILIAPDERKKRGNAVEATRKSLLGRASIRSIGEKAAEVKGQNGGFPQWWR